MRLEALYLVDDSSYLHLTETAAGFDYEIYNKGNYKKQFDGNLSWLELNDSPIRNPLAAARALVFKDVDLDAEVVSTVKLKILERILREKCTYKEVHSNNSKKGHLFH